MLLLPKIRKTISKCVFYNLQAIIVVEFKVNNERAVRFHRWAGQIVKD